MAGEIEARLKALDLVLPEVRSPRRRLRVLSSPQRPALRLGPDCRCKDGKVAVTGKLGADVDLAQGQEAARLCALNILAQAKAALARSRPHRPAAASERLRQRGARLRRPSQSDQRRLRADRQGARATRGAIRASLSAARACRSAPPSRSMRSSRWIRPPWPSRLPMPELYWLKRPIAHRGLHDAAKGIIENSASAVERCHGQGLRHRGRPAMRRRSTCRSSFMTRRSTG